MAATQLEAPEGISTVLLGCGDPRVSEAMAGHLRAWHVAVEAVADGAAALAALQRSAPPEIALLDMDLAAPSGMEIVWTVRRQAARRTWIALLSARAGAECIRAALEAGCDDFLAIPAEPEDLKVRLRVAERVLTLQRQIHRQSEELHYRSTHDGLTGLWNREALLSLIFQETDRVQRMKTPLSLLLLDLDDFSTINHDYGYDAGDRVLTELANRFRRTLRSYDLIGRCGGDEFLLALPGCGAQSAGNLAERIRATLLARPFAVRNGASTLTGSFGVAESGGRSPLVVLREAERALAEAKAAGKNCARCFVAPRAEGLKMGVQSVQPLAEPKAS